MIKLKEIITLKFTFLQIVIEFNPIKILSLGSYNEWPRFDVMWNSRWFDVIRTCCANFKVVRRVNPPEILNVLLYLNLTLAYGFNRFGVQIDIVSILFDTIRIMCDINF